MQPNKIFRRRVNVGPNERLASILSGGALLSMAVLRPKRLGLFKALSGGYMLYRGISGNCMVYDTLGLRRGGPAGQHGLHVERAMTINRPRQEVYDYWRNFENLPAFMHHLDDVQVTGPTSSHWTARGPLDTQVEWDADIVEELPGELISWQSRPGATVENHGTVRFVDAPGGNGTEVHVTLSYSPPGGSSGAALAALFGEEPGMQVRDDLRRFKQIMETGETATVQGQTSGRLEQVAEERDLLQRRRRKDVVQKASEDSFPASDAPGWAPEGSQEG